MTALLYAEIPKEEGCYEVFLRTAKKISAIKCSLIRKGDCLALLTFSFHFATC